jgi:hypothetical protein
MIADETAREDLRVAAALSNLAQGQQAEKMVT